MQRVSTGCITALLLAFAVLLSPPALAQSRHDCEDAKQLPADADEESRRITCEIPDKYRLEVTMAEFIGKMIRLHDMAAWLTTDALQEIKAFEGIQGQGRGWLTLQGKDDDIEVRYFTEHDGRTSAIASATLDGDSFKAKDARKLSPSEPMSEREARLMRAKALALSSEATRLCTNHTPNTVVIESDEVGRKEILVFVMSAWVAEDEAPLGGYHLFRINETGDTIVSRFSQTRACPMAVGKQLMDSEALTVTHLTSMTPTMFHVFMGLQYRKPIYVSTTQNGLLWRVERGQIFLVKDESGATSHSDSSATPTSTGK